MMLRLTEFISGDLTESWHQQVKVLVFLHSTELFLQWNVLFFQSDSPIKESISCHCIAELIS